MESRLINHFQISTVKIKYSQMLIHLTLYGLLRETLPREARGKADIELPENAVLQDLISHLRIIGPVVFSLNNEIERELSRPLASGDQVHIFRPTGGG